LEAQELASLTSRANALAGDAQQDASSRRLSALRLAIDLWGSIDSLERQVDSAGIESSSDAAIRKLAVDSDPLIATLFEGFLPPAMRIAKVSQETIWSDLSGLQAAPERGRSLFVDRNRLQCLQCHQLGKEGFELGPRLDGVGSRLTANQIFEALHDPNRQISPSYQTHALLHTDGSILQGLIRSRDGDRITLATAKGTLETWDARELSEIKELPNSLMPSGLTLQMTGQEVADLVAYLASLK
jgi:putative heme-binding domain-containing protein